MTSQDITKFEFVLTLGKHIVIQRYFNVKDYNYKSKNSMDIYYEISDICEEISYNLKLKSMEYEYEELNYITDSHISDDDQTNKDEHFLLELKLGNDVFISRIFPAHVYHPRARYTVDVRQNVKKYLLNLSNILSSNDLEKSYLEYELK